MLGIWKNIYKIVDIAVNIFILFLPKYKWVKKDSQS